LDREGFKPITKLRSWLFPRAGAIAPLANLHAAINRNQASIRIEAERKEEAYEEERQKFLGKSHINFILLQEFYIIARMNPFEILFLFHEGKSRSTSRGGAPMRDMPCEKRRASRDVRE
jgi:hypothetical protein